MRVETPRPRVKLAATIRRTHGLTSRPVSDFSHLTRDCGIRADIAASFDRESRSLRRPGSKLSSGDKVTVAAAVRKLRRGDDAAPSQLPPPVGDIVTQVTLAPSAVRRPWVDHVAASDLGITGYVETLALVSRIAAVDAFHRVLGIRLPALPDARPGEPTGDFNPMAKPSKAFVPMTRGTSIWWSLTLVPEAYTRMEDLHCVLYLSPEEMQAASSPRAVTRPQMELVAARTSAVNECFY